MIYSVYKYLYSRMTIYDDKKQKKKQKFCFFSFIIIFFLFLAFIAA